MNKRYLALALVVLAIPIVVNTVNKMTINDWQKTYYIKELTPEYKLAMASFIYYLVQKTPSEKMFGQELKIVLEAFPGHPTHFRQGLIKLFEQSFIQAYEASQLNNPNKYRWKLSLLEFYRSLWEMIEGSRLINYGSKEGQQLPNPQNF